MYEGNHSVQRVIHELLEPIREKGGDHVFIVEGVFALISELLPFYDYKIWVEYPEKMGFERGLQRDIKLNDIDNSEKWLNHWLPKEQEYINKEEPQKKADYIIDATS